MSNCDMNQDITQREQSWKTRGKRMIHIALDYVVVGIVLSVITTIMFILTTYRAWYNNFF